MQSTIVIKDLSVDCVIGVYPHERLAPQNIRFDVELVVRLGEADHIDCTIDYDQVASLLMQIAQQGQFQLIESCASRSVEGLLSSFPTVVAGRLTVKKPNAVPQATYAAVSVDIVRFDPASARPAVLA